MFARLARSLAAVVGVLLAALTVVVTLQVLGRYVPVIPRPLWTEEIARWLLAWMVFLGAAVALRRSDHFVIDLIPRRVDERFGRVLQMLVLVTVLAISVIILVGGVMLTQGGLTRISTASGLHLAWAFAALPVGGLFMTVFSIELAVRVLRGDALDDHEEPGIGGTAGPPDAATPPGTPRPREGGDRTARAEHDEGER